MTSEEAKRAVKALEAIMKVHQNGRYLEIHEDGKNGVEVIAVLSDSSECPGPNPKLLKNIVKELIAVGEVMDAEKAENDREEAEDDGWS